MSPYYYIFILILIFKLLLSKNFSTLPPTANSLLSGHSCQLLLQMFIEIFTLSWNSCSNIIDSLLSNSSNISSGFSFLKNTEMILYDFNEVFFLMNFFSMVLIFLLSSLNLNFVLVISVYALRIRMNTSFDFTYDTFLLQIMYRLTIINPSVKIKHNFVLAIWNSFFWKSLWSKKIY